MAREGADLSFLRILSDEELLEGFEERVFETTKVSEAARHEIVQPEKSHDATISFPMIGHTAKSLRNLVTMVYCRGKLLSKSTGGEFSCTDELVERLRECEDIEEIITVSKEGLTGVKFTEDEIAFTGFPPTQDPELLSVFTQLSERINEKAKERDHVIARRLDETNERYIFRCWLIAIGMKGPEFKAARKLLLSPLHGHSAFKDDAMKSRWEKNRAASKRNNKVR